MPILTPGNNGYKPKDWRYPYDALRAFKTAVGTVSIKLGKPRRTDGWHIIYPGRFQGMADPRWQLVFVNLNDNMETVYIGSDARTAEKTIRQLHKQYIEALLVSGQSTSRDPRDLQKQNDPRFNPNVVKSMMERWNEMRKVKSVAEWKANAKANPDVVAFMKSKAGFLSMTMEDYLYKHPLSHSWPTPPTSEQQLKARVRQREEYERQLQKAKELQEQTNQPDQGPGWAYDQ